MAFRKFGGLNYAPNNNIVHNTFSSTKNITITNQVGSPNSNLSIQSNLDMSGNSLFEIGEAHFETGFITSGSGALTFDNSTSISSGIDFNAGAGMTLRGMDFNNAAGTTFRFNTTDSGTISLHNQTVSVATGDINLTAPTGQTIFIDPLLTVPKITTRPGTDLFVSTGTTDGHVRIDRDVNVSGDIIHTGVSQFIGNVGITGTLGVTGTSVFDGQVGITGLFGVTGHSVFDGSVGVTGMFGVTGRSTFNGESTFNGSIIFNGSIGVTDALGATGGFGVTGASIFNGSVGITGYFGVTGRSTFDGSVGITGLLGVTGACVFNGTVEFVDYVPTCKIGPTGNYDLTNKQYVNSVVSAGGVTLFNNNNDWYGENLFKNKLGISAPFGVTGASTFNGSSVFNGQVGVSGPFGVTGASTFNGSSVFNGQVGVSGSFGVTGASTFNGPSTFIGQVGVSGPFGVTGTSTFNGSSTFIGQVGVSGPFGVTGASTFIGQVGVTGLFGVTGASTFDGHVGVTGQFSVTGTSTFNGSLGVTELFGVTGTSTFDGSVGVTGLFGVTGASTFNGSVGINPTVGSHNAEALNISNIGSSNRIGFIPNINAAAMTYNSLTVVNESLIYAGASMDNGGLSIVPWSNTSCGIRLTKDTALIGAGGITNDPTSSISCSNGNVSVKGTLTLSDITPNVTLTQTDLSCLKGTTGGVIQNQLNGKVNLTGAETIAGIKTFSNNITFQAIVSFPNSTSINNGEVKAVSFDATSDYRIKQNVTNLGNTYTLDNLRPVSYYNTKLQCQDLGFIAHEVQQEIPHIVTGEKDGEKLQSINYNRLIPILVKELNEQKQENKQNKELINKLMQSNEYLMKHVNELIKKLL